MVSIDYFIFVQFTRMTLMYFSLSLFCGLSAFAEPIDPFTIPDEAQRFRQERQVVTVAARYAQTIEEAPSIVRVITADDIVQQGFADF